MKNTVTESRSLIISFGTLIGVGVITAILSEVPLTAPFLTLALLVIWFFIQDQMFTLRVLTKNFWILTYLRTDSPIRPWLSTNVLNRCFSIILAIPLSIITYIPLFEGGWKYSTSVSVSIFIALVLHTLLRNIIQSNISENLVEIVHIRILMLLGVSCIISILTLTSIYEDIKSDYSEMTSNEIASQTISDVHHPVQFIQDCARTLRYAELQLLRARDSQKHPYGWLIYLFLLTPSILTAIGQTMLYLGVERLSQRTSIT